MREKGQKRLDKERERGTHMSGPAYMCAIYLRMFWTLDELFSKFKDLDMHFVSWGTWMAH